MDYSIRRKSSDEDTNLKTKEESPVPEKSECLSIKCNQDNLYQIPEESPNSDMLGELTVRVHEEIMRLVLQTTQDLKGDSRVKELPKSSTVNTEQIKKLLDVLDHALRTHTNLALFNKMKYKISI